MALWKQTVLSAVLGVMALVAWAAYVPAAQPIIDRLGLLQPLRDAGLVADQTDEAGGPAAGGPSAGNRGGGGTEVVAVAAQSRPLSDLISAIGTARGARSVTVQAEVSGQVMAVHVAPGQQVTAGQLIATLDSEAAQIALDRAALIRADAEATWGRIEALAARGAATKLQVQDADLALKTAALQYREAAFELQRHQISAPIAGTVGLMAAEQGDRLGDGDEISRIEDQSSLIVDFRVPERIVSRLSAGMAVQVVPLADPGMVLTGTIFALDNRVDETSRTLLVQARIANQDNRLRAGMAFSITLAFQGAALPAVDPLAIQWGSAGSFVWVVRATKAVRLPVQIIQRNADAVVIKADLQAGDLVVTEGVQALRPDADVVVSGAAPAAATN